MAQASNKRSWGDWYMIFFGVVFALCGLLMLLDKGGLLPQDTAGGGVPYATERLRFDNKECLRRNAYHSRSIDPMITDNILSSDVARRCAVEREAFYRQSL